MQSALSATFDPVELRDARARTLALLRGLSEERLTVPPLEHLNPILWETGHVAYFAEFWTLRHLHGRAPMLEDADRLYDSARVAHDTRRHLPLPNRAQTIDFLNYQLDATLAALEHDGNDPERLYYYRLALFHEDMHDEAMLYALQSLGYPAPAFDDCVAPSRSVTSDQAAHGDASVPGGTYRVGAERGERAFIFDNEQWAHDERIEPFRIARAAVTNAHYLQFVEDGGYRQAALWNDAGWAWRVQADAAAPIYWRCDPDAGWQRRHFDRWIPLHPSEPVVHVNAFEAQAYCRWAGRRLPTEAEWEVAAEGAATGAANLDGADVIPAAARTGVSRYGCRQMIGNVWEWTASPFMPYAGFTPGPYKEYSEPWFGSHIVLRGGAWSTRRRLIWRRWRNFYRPHRRDVIAGFRTCAL